MIPDAGIATFRDRGLLRLPGALPADAVARARDAASGVISSASTFSSSTLGILPEG